MNEDGSGELREDRPWHDRSLSAEHRVASLLQAMTLREKVAQLYGVWVGASPTGGDVAPFQHDMSDDIDLESLLVHGLGQLTRPFGSAPIDAAVGAVSLARAQSRIVGAGRFGIPALAHEECLAGFTTWGATAYPIPLSWGASFDPALIERMAARIGTGMAAVGVHQGLAPVLDVTRDPRWGRTEETISEDPYLVGTVASAYIRGLQSTGIVATLKHFIGYSGSKAGRNLAPVSVGQREFNDVFVPPFEMAVRETGVGSVMHSYTDVDGVPSASDATLLTTLLRDTWGFTGTVVADYFGIAFLKTLHGVAADWGQAAALALTAGVDVELPTVKTYAEPLLAEIAAGRLDEGVVDAATTRVLLQKLQLGLLDADWSPLPAGFTGEHLESIDLVRGRLDLDTAEDRAVARQIADEAVVVLSNDGTLPLDSATPRRIAIVGPCADNALSFLGCYSFPSHVGAQHPEIPLGIDIPTLLDAVTAEFGDSEIVFQTGCSIDGLDRAGFDAARDAARSADVVIVALGDRAGLFGRGTSGEGCDVSTMRLPGLQQDFLDEILATGTPTILTLLAGRPYALGDAPERAAAIVQTFFAGEEGASAIAGVLSGRVSPSGRLPVSVPATTGGQPATYLSSPLAGASGVSNLDPTPRFAFGHGLSYTAFDWSDVRVTAGAGASAGTDADAGTDAGRADGAVTAPTDGAFDLTVTITNTGGRDGAEIVQLYLNDPVASVVRPVRKLIGFARVELQPGASRHVTFVVPADLAAFTGRDGRRIVEPGELNLMLGSSSSNILSTSNVWLSGPVRVVDHTRRLHCEVTIAEHPSSAPVAELSAVLP